MFKAVAISTGASIPAVCVKTLVWMGTLIHVVSQFIKSLLYEVWIATLYV